MRRPLDEARLHDFLRQLGQQANADLRIYLTGGATAVLLSPTEDRLRRWT